MHSGCADPHSIGRMVFGFRACEQVRFICLPTFLKNSVTFLIVSDNLLLGNRPLDEIHIQRTSDQAFVVSFDIPLWQRRMKAIGQVDFEFIASGKHISSLMRPVSNCTPATGRMWSVTFFSTDPSSPITTSGKSRKGTNTWHVMVCLLESSLPTFFNSQLVVAIPSPLVPGSIQTPRLRETRSATFPSSVDKQHQSRSSMYDYNCDRDAYSLSFRGHNALAPSEEDEDRYPTSFSPELPPPTHPLRGSPSSPRSSTATAPPITIRLRSGKRKLGGRVGELPSTYLNFIHSIAL